MKVTYDDEVQALYIYLRPENEKGIVKKTIPIDSGDFKAGIYLDIDIHDKPIGFEILLDDATQEGRDILLKHFDIRKDSK